MRISPALPLLLLAFFEAPSTRAATRLKELVALEGMRDNQLIGYGLVVGLNGTGDRKQTILSAQSLANMLERMGVSIPPQAITVKNTAAVMVTATLPPFAQPGSHIDATAAAIGDAQNLQGGLMLLTGLRGADGQVYAVVQGPVVTGGFVAGNGGNNQTVNHPTVGRVPGGAIVERTAPSVTPNGRVRLQLRDADFTTSARIAEAVNRKFSANGAPVAHAENSALVSVSIPPDYAARSIEFLSELEKVPVDADRPSRVVINERTGTIVMGGDVHISPVAIMHGNLTIEIQTTFAVSQPAALGTGTSEIVPQVGVGSKEEKARNLILKQGATCEELVRALSSIGSTPRDIISILQNLRAAGALEAELKVI
jgi:flagellar P-ring protein precursor FlgI